MSTEQPPMSEKKYRRIVSRRLKQIGFKYGVPIERAEANFTIQQALRGLRYQSGDAGVLTFRLPDRVVTMQVTSIRNYGVDGWVFNEEADMMREIFGPGRRGLNDDAFIFDGLLLEPDAGLDELQVVTSEDAYDALEKRDPLDYANILLRVSAFVQFDPAGRPEGAIIQCPPAPLDQMLFIPPR